MGNTEYAITSLTLVQLAQNNRRYRHYRKVLQTQCQTQQKRKDEIEVLLWSNCSDIHREYAHCNHVADIIGNNRSMTGSVYFCRAIYVKKVEPNDDDNDSENNHQDVESENELLDDAIAKEEVLDLLPLYILHFRNINEDDSALNVKSFCIANGHSSSSAYSHSHSHSQSQSFHSYSQPLISLKNKLSSNKNTKPALISHSKYGSTNRSWHELMKQEEEQCHGSTFDVNRMIDKLLSVRSAQPGTMVDVERKDIENLCAYSKYALSEQPVFLELEAPIKVVGDIHGQYFDLLRLLEYGRFPPFTNYLFLGDYVDRGGQSLECICLLLCFKIKFEENFFLLRGNHESESINRIYGFYDECKRRYSVRVWRKFVDVFNHLPVAATISNQIFCVHGGLSPQLFLGSNKESADGDRLSFDACKKIQRPTEVGDVGLVCDLLWSDPSFDVDGFYDNVDRGVSYYFGRDIVDCFCKLFEMDLICRAHQVVEDGYEFFNKRTLVTIFSAPNYCGEFDNCAAFMEVDDTLKCGFQIMDPQRKHRPQNLMKREN